MKKIILYFKHNYQKLFIQVVSIISAFIIFVIPASATEYGLNFQFYDGTGSGSTHDGGIYFYTYNYGGSGKYIYYPQLSTHYGKQFRQTNISSSYNQVAVIFNYPVSMNDWQSVWGTNVEKFYIEFPIVVEFGNMSSSLGGPGECFLSSVEFFSDVPVGNVVSNTAKYSVDLNIPGVQGSSQLTTFIVNVGFTIVPTTTLIDLTTVSFNFVLPKQNSDFYVIARPNGNVILKTGDDIPVRAPIIDSTISDVHKQEQNLLDSNKAGFDSANDMFGTITDNVMGFPELLKGFNVVSGLINNATTVVPGMYIILLISLVLGLFAFIVGMSHSIHSLVSKIDYERKDE